VPEPLPATRLGRAARLVVLISGSGTLLQALIDACADPAYGAEIVAVGSDRPEIQGLERAVHANIPTFVESLEDHATRADWDRALTADVAAYEPDLVISAGFMKLVGRQFLARFPRFLECMGRGMRWLTASRSPEPPCFWSIQESTAA
jgi:folate-dependent phosphoribosylglycinamide formyltransferase PurN